MIVLDASVLLASEDGDDAHHGAAARLLEQGMPLATLDLAIYETTNVAIARWKDAEAAERLRERCFAIAEYGQLVRVASGLAETAAGIAATHGISAYDAAYVATARALRAPLASCDERDLVSRGLASLPNAVLTDAP